MFHWLSAFTNWLYQRHPDLSLLVFTLLAVGFMSGFFWEIRKAARENYLPIVESLLMPRGWARLTQVLCMLGFMSSGFVLLFLSQQDLNPTPPRGLSKLVWATFVLAVTVISLWIKRWRSDHRENRWLNRTLRRSGIQMRVDKTV